jgi:hypothetical protein
MIAVWIFYITALCFTGVCGGPSDPIPVRVRGTVGDCEQVRAAVEKYFGDDVRVTPLCAQDK